jgi:hypothetical protein
MSLIIIQHDSGWLSQLCDLLRARQSGFNSPQVQEIPSDQTGFEIPSNLLYNRYSGKTDWNLRLVSKLRMRAAIPQFLRAVSWWAV